MKPNKSTDIQTLENGNQYLHRVLNVFTLNTLERLWNVYLGIEENPNLYKKYIKGDIVGEPVDYKHPKARFHASLYEENMLEWCAIKGIVPGIQAVGTDGQVYQKETRVSIPSPPQGMRIPYKHEMALLKAKTALLERTKE